MDIFTQVERLNKVADIIETEPERFDMSYWMRWVDAHGNTRYTNETDRPVEVVEGTHGEGLTCDTVCCIAGWAVSLWPSEVADDDDWVQAGARILGINHRDAHDLFHDFSFDAASAAEHLRQMAWDAYQEWSQG